MATIYAIQNYKYSDWNFDIYIESNVDPALVPQRIKELQVNDTLNRTYQFLSLDLTREEFYKID